jgi:hypothetical protein
VVEINPAVFVGYDFLFWVYLVLSRENHLRRKFMPAKKKAAKKKKH